MSNQIKRFNGTIWTDITNGAIVDTNSIQTISGAKAFTNGLTSEGTSYLGSKINHYVNSSTNYDLSFPTKSGTFALTSDIPTKLSDLTERGEAWLSWGGRDLAGSFGPIDAAMIPMLGANRLAGMPANNINVEYSNDGGSTWTSYGATDDQKVSLLTTSSLFNVGKAGKTATANSRLRITIDSSGVLYTILEKYAIFLSTEGSSGSKCTYSTIDYSGVETVRKTMDVSGWSGWNILNTPPYIIGSAYYGNIRYIRFTFTITGASTQFDNLSVYQICGYGGVGWTTPSVMAQYGVPYSWNYNLDVTFPKSVTATSFVKSGGTASQFLKADGSVDSTSYATQSWVTSQGYLTFHLYRPIKLSGTTILSNVSSSALNFVSGDSTCLTISNSSGTLTFTPNVAQSISGSGLVDTQLLREVANAKQDKLTTAQLNAVNSGITATKVATYDAYKTDIDNAVDHITTNEEDIQLLQLNKQNKESTTILYSSAVSGLVIVTGITTPNTLYQKSFTLSRSVSGFSRVRVYYYVGTAASVVYIAEGLINGTSGTVSFNDYYASGTANVVVFNGTSAKLYAMCIIASSYAGQSIINITKVEGISY